MIIYSHFKDAPIKEALGFTWFIDDSIKDNTIFIFTKEQAEKYLKERLEKAKRIKQ